jgi:hypothetical protein
LHFSLGKVRVTISGADWLKKKISGGSFLPNVDRGWCCSWKKNPLSPCFVKTNNTPKVCFKDLYSRKDTYGKYLKFLRVIYGSLGLLFVCLGVDVTILMCVTNWSGWSFFFLVFSEGVTEATLRHHLPALVVATR